MMILHHQAVTHRQPSSGGIESSKPPTPFGETLKLEEEGKDLRNKGDYVGAIEKFKEARTIFYNTSPTFGDNNAKVIEMNYHLGKVYQEKGDHDNAISYFSDTITFAAKQGKTPMLGEYVLRAKSYLAKGVYDKVVQDCTKEIDYFSNCANPDFFSSNIISGYLIRSDAYAKNGKDELSIADLKSAADWGNTDALEKLKEKGIDYKPKKPKKGSSSSSSTSASSSGGSSSSIITKIIGAVIGAIIGGGVAGWFLGATLKKKFIVIGIIAAVVLLFGQRIIGSIGNKTSTSQIQTATATVTQNVNFRKGPSTDNEVIRQLKQGDKVTLTGETQGGWTQITHSGDTGWVSSEYLSASAASGTTASSEAAQAQPQQTQTAAVTPAPKATVTVDGNTVTNVFNPRIRGFYGAKPADAYIYRITTSGNDMNIYISQTASGAHVAVGSNVFNDYGDRQNVRLQNLDNPSQVYLPEKGMMPTHSWDGSNEWFAFKGVSGSRFSLTITYDTPNLVWAEINVGSE
jgi:uncharacterized protein YraI